MNKKLLTTAIVVTFLALAALLGYSIERTAWLFGQFETESWWLAAYAAAIVVELAAVALIVGAGALAHLDAAARAWANRALVAVLSVGALANLSAGYLRGGHKVLWAFGGGYASLAVAASLWLVVNLAVPGLILCLSKLLERLIHAGGKPSVAARRKRQVKRLIGLLRTWRGQLAVLRAQLAEKGAEAAAASAQLRDVSAQLRTAEQQSAAAAEQADQGRAQSARLADQVRTAEAHAAAAADQVRTAQEEAERLRSQLAERSAEAAALSAAASLDVRSIAQSLRDAGVSLRTIGAALGVSEKTIRNWTMDVRTNGHSQAAH